MAVITYEMWIIIPPSQDSCESSQWNWNASHILCACFIQRDEVDYERICMLGGSRIHSFAFVFLLIQELCSSRNLDRISQEHSSFREALHNCLLAFSILTADGVCWATTLCLWFLTLWCLHGHVGDVSCLVLPPPLLFSCSEPECWSLIWWSQWWLGLRGECLLWVQAVP